MSPRARLRGGLLLVSGAVFLAIGLLADRALDAALQERQLREQLVAERVHDELEEALTELVEVEDRRPFFQWREAYVGESGALELSPLASAPEPPIRGYFQIDPDGAVSTPRPDPDVAPQLTRWTRGLSGWGGASQPRPDRVVEVVVPEPIRKAVQVAAQVPEPAPVPVVQAAPEPVPASGDEQQIKSLADADRALNQGSVPRKTRKSWSYSADEAQIGNFVQSGPSSGWNPPQAPLPAPSPPAPPPPVVQPTVPTVPAGPSFRRLRVTVPAEVPAEVDVAIAPFEAAAVGPDLVLSRTVRIGGRTWVQGLALDVPALQRQLEERVLGATGLAQHVHIAWSPSEADGVYRFAPPFDTWTARITLSGLGQQGPSPWGWIAAFAAITAGVTGAGLLLAYRAASAGYAAAEQRADFVSAVTHELRAPLTSIRLYSEMLEADVVVELERRRSYLATIRGEAERLTRLVDDVLAFARIERGRPAEHLPDTPLSEAIDRVLALHRPQLAEARLQVELDLGDAASVRVPGDVVAQVLGNLLDNARKFSVGSAEPTLSITAWGRLTLSVRDHGPGVPERQLQRIFQPFVRGERELQRRTRGSGIGLALVAGLVRDLGGTVSARNADGGGLEVTVSWPA
jgi:signal transduction histidine kinase